MTHVLVASDKFKGSLTAADVGEAVSTGIRGVYPDTEVVVVPVADGGDGTLAAAIAAGYRPGPGHGERADRRAGRDPVRQARGSRRGGTGRRLGTLAAARRSRTADGEQPRHRRGDRRGARRRLPADRARHRRQRQHRRRRRAGQRARWPAARCGRRRDRRRRRGSGRTSTGSTCRACIRGWPEAEIVVACDVDNPLTGPHGAAAVYGPQKGASPDDIARARRRAGPVGRRRRGGDRRRPPGPPGRRRGRRRRLRRDRRARRAAAPRDRPDLRPGRLPSPAGRRRAGGHRRGVAGRADPARQGTRRCRRRRRAPPGSRSWRSAAAAC